MPYVVIRDQSGRLLSRQELTSPSVVGRALGCDIWVQDTQVSRQHCQIELRHGQWIVADLGSRNGTTVNGERITERVLADSDTIEVGKDRITFYKGAMPTRRAADPLLAGLTDIEELASRPAESSDTGSPLSGSSLFASRVTADESTVDAISPVVPQDPSDRTLAPATRSPGRRAWPVWLGLATAAGTAVVAWLALT